MTLLYEPKGGPWWRRPSVAIALWQAPSYLVVLFAMTFVYRRVGSDGFGEIAFAQAIGAAVSVVTAYGFDVGMTARVAVMPEDDRGSRLSSAWLVQLIAAMVAAPLVIAVAFVRPTDRLTPQLALLSLLLVASSISFPNWALIGAGTLGRVVRPYIIVRLALIPLCLVALQEHADASRYLFLLGTTGLFAGLMASVVGFRGGALPLAKPRRRLVVETAQDLRPLWISSLWVSAYVVVVPLVVGFVSTPVQSAAFAVATLGRTVLQSFVSPFLTARLRTAALLANQGLAALRAQLGRSLVAVSVVLCPPALLFALFGDRMLRLAGGGDLASAFEPARVLAFVPLMTALSGLLGTQYLLNCGHAGFYNRTLRLASVTALVCLIPVVRTFGALGAAWLTMILEVSITAVFGIRVAADRHSTWNGTSPGAALRRAVS